MLESVRRGLLRAIPAGGGRRRVDILCTDDESIARLAGRYRGSPRPTDVLAFGYGEEALFGEVAISLDTARRQARSRGVPLEQELLLLCLHGLLHVAGQDDETPAGWRAMRVSEFAALARALG